MNNKKISIISLFFGLFVLLAGIFASSLIPKSKTPNLSLRLNQSSIFINQSSGSGVHNHKTIKSAQSERFSLINNKKVSFKNANFDHEINFFKNEEDANFNVNFSIWDSTNRRAIGSSNQKLSFYNKNENEKIDLVQLKKDAFSDELFKKPKNNNGTKNIKINSSHPIKINENHTYIVKATAFGKTIDIIESNGKTLFNKQNFNHNSRPYNHIINKDNNKLESFSFNYSWSTSLDWTHPSILDSILGSSIKGAVSFKIEPQKYALESSFNPSFKIESFIEISKNELNAVLPHIFTVLDNTTTEKNIKKEGATWVSPTKKPKLHIGLNNEIFQAYKSLLWKNKALLKKELDHLSSSDKSLLTELIKSYKVNSKNYKTTYNKLLAGERIYKDSFSLPSWTSWLNNQSPKVNGINLIKWLAVEKTHPIKINENNHSIYTKTNYQLLSQWIQNQSQIKLCYRYSTSPKIIEASLNPYQLTDYKIPLINNRADNNYPYIEILGITFLWEDNYKNADHNFNSFQKMSELKNVKIQDNMWFFDDLPDILEPSHKFKYIVKSTSGNQKFHNKEIYSIRVETDSKNLDNEIIVFNLSNGQKIRADKDFDLTNQNLFIEKHTKYEYIKNIFPGFKNSSSKGLINYSTKNNRYTANYQPNPLDISQGIRFYPVLDEKSQNITYDEDLNVCEGEVKTNQKAYKSFFYDVIIDGKKKRASFFQIKNAPKPLIIDEIKNENPFDHPDFFADLGKEEFSYFLEWHPKNNQKILFKIVSNSNQKTIVSNIKTKKHKSIPKKWFSEQSGNKFILFKIPSLDDKKITNYSDVLKNWHKSFKSTAPPPGENVNMTLENWLQNLNQDYNKENITFIINHKLILVISPYKEQKDAHTNNIEHFRETDFKIIRVEDRGNGSEINVLRSLDSERVSSSINQGFGINLMGRYNEEGKLDDGFHDLYIKTTDKSNQGRYNQKIGCKIYIDSSPPVPKINSSSSFPDKKLYIKLGSDYFDLYTSTKAIDVLVKDQGMKNFHISWVDSNGVWERLKIDVENHKSDDEYLQSVFQNINFQGLFKVEFTDIANNSGIFFLWIQKPKKNGNNPLISQMQLVSTNAKNHLFNFNQDQYFWVDQSKLSNNNPVEFKASNVLSQNMNIHKKDENGNWIPAQKTDFELLHNQEKISSVGVPIESINTSNNLMGDEIEPIWVSDSFENNFELLETLNYQDLADNPEFLEDLNKPGFLYELTQVNGDGTTPLFKITHFSSELNVHGEKEWEEWMPESNIKYRIYKYRKNSDSSFWVNDAVLDTGTINQNKDFFISSTSSNGITINYKYIIKVKNNQALKPLNNSLVINSNNILTLKQFILGNSGVLGTITRQKLSELFNQNKNTPLSKDFYIQRVLVQTFNGYSLKIKNPGEYKINFETNIYYKTEDIQGNIIYKPIQQTVNILNSNSYNLNIKHEDLWNVTNYDQNAKFDNDSVLIDASSSIPDSSVKRVNKNYKVQLLSEFINLKTLKIMRSDLGNNKWVNETNNLYDGFEITFAKEGLYQIEYEDKASIIHSTKLLVFDWPHRDFSKYSVQTTIDDNGKPKLVKLQFYLKPGIASIMEKQEVEVIGQTSLPYNQILDSEISEYINSEYKNISGFVWSVDEKSINLPSWVKVSKTDEQKSPTEKLYKFTLSGSGTAKKSVFNNVNDFSYASASSNWAVKKRYWLNQNIDQESNNLAFIAQKIGDGILIKNIGQPIPLSNEEIETTAFFKGKYVNLYQLSNYDEKFLIDHDQDLNTPKVHHLKDLNLFLYEFEEWKAKNGLTTEIPGSSPPTTNSSNGPVNPSQIVQDLSSNKPDEASNTPPKNPLEDKNIKKFLKDYNDTNNSNKDKLSKISKDKQEAKDQGYEFDENTGNIIFNAKNSSASEPPSTNKNTDSDATSLVENQDSEKQKPLSQGVYFGIILGSLVASLGLLFFIMFIIKKRRGLRHK